MKPSNSPTQGQPNPTKKWLKVGFGPLFPIANSFSWVGIGLMWETDYKKPNPTKILRKHPSSTNSSSKDSKDSKDSDGINTNNSKGNGNKRRYRKRWR